ncbi:CaiB/BaiF CoA-transferase family protein [Pseudomonas alkylphenolica]|uniref:CaiB/BaiF CoA transferase family protein n=1 Tax=Pseudomonas alkylphenolica TaxID=237609 RepID=UPI00315D626E
MQTKQGPLSGLKVLEIAGLGPGPFCGMLLADLGADVVLVERGEQTADEIDMGKGAIYKRGKRSVGVDLKSPEGIQTVLRLVEHSDALIEGMRPGVMERLGLGPDVCLQRNPRLVYGRMTGWGQDGPLAQAAGHDMNYIALAGALWYAGQPGQAPIAPPSLVGDVGGGALYLAIGLLAGIMNARATGKGQVIDAAIVDGCAHMQNLLLSAKAGGQLPNERGQSGLDGPHWYNTYQCADGNYISVGSLEPRFYAVLRQLIGLGDDPETANGYNPRTWPHLREKFASIFAQRTREQWCAILEGTDACFAPVLNLDEAADHPHLQARKVFDRESGMLQANPAPRFSATPAGRPGPLPERGEHTDEVLREWLD